MQIGFREVASNKCLAFKCALGNFTKNEKKLIPFFIIAASDKPDLGLEELSTLNVKSRFQVFEKASIETTNDIERSPSQVAVKRSPSILSKLAK